MLSITKLRTYNTTLSYQNEYLNTDINKKKNRLCFILPQDDRLCFVNKHLDLIPIHLVRTNKKNHLNCSAISLLSYICWYFIW